MPKNHPETHAADSAFPYDTEDGNWPLSSGMTKREFFASRALQGLCANPEFETQGEKEKKMAAAHAVALANTLCDELNYYN